MEAEELLKAISLKCFEVKKEFALAPSPCVPIWGRANDLADSIIHLMAESYQDEHDKEE